MHITQSQKSGKHTISNLTDEDLVTLYHALQNKGYDARKMADKIEQHLIDCQDEEKIQAEYGYDAAEYVKRLLDPTCPNFVNDEYKENWINYDSNKGESIVTEVVEPMDEATSEVEETDPKFIAKLEKDALDRPQIVIKGKPEVGGYHQINILLEEIEVADIDNLIKQLMIVKEGM